MASKQNDQQIQQIYADEMKGPRAELSEKSLDVFLVGSYATKDPTEYHPLHLVVEPSKFVISSEGTKFSIKSLNTHKQDLIVTCTSYLYHIKSPRGHHGMKSQVFHRMKQNESIQFEICERGPNDLVSESNIGSCPSFANGYLEITHYRTDERKNLGDSDADWNVVAPNQMVTPLVYQEEIYGYWKDFLVPAMETDEIKKKRADFAKKYVRRLEKNDVATFTSNVTGKTMTTSKMDCDSEKKKNLEKGEVESTPTQSLPKKKKKKCLIQ